MTPRHTGLHVALAGAGGTTGSAVLQDWLGRAEVARVTVLTTQRFLQMPPRMADAVVHGEAWQDALPTADHAVIVCGTPRRARESVYWQPPREQLVPLATAWRARGVRSLEVVLAHAPLSAADHTALQQLGFDRFTQRRLTPARVTPTTARWPERLAAWMLATLLSVMQQVAASRRQRPRRGRALQVTSGASPRSASSRHTHDGGH